METYEIRAEERPEQPTAVAEATLSVAEIGPFLAKTYAAVADVLGRQGAHPVGPPFARYEFVTGGCVVVEAGFPVLAAVTADGEVYPSTLPGGPVAVTMHVGPYDAMQPAYEALVLWVHHHRSELAGDPWEIYLSDPEAERDPATWRTEIVQPYRPA